MVGNLNSVQSFSGTQTQRQLSHQDLAVTPSRVNEHQQRIFPKDDLHQRIFANEHPVQETLKEFERLDINGGEVLIRERELTTSLMRSRDRSKSFGRMLKSSGTSRSRTSGKDVKSRKLARQVQQILASSTDNHKDIQQVKLVLDEALVLVEDNSYQAYGGIVGEI